MEQPEHDVIRQEHARIQAEKDIVIQQLQNEIDQLKRSKLPSSPRIQSLKCDIRAMLTHLNKINKIKVQRQLQADEVVAQQNREIVKLKQKLVKISHQKETQILGKSELEEKGIRYAQIQQKAELSIEYARQNVLDTIFINESMHDDIVELQNRIKEEQDKTEDLSLTVATLTEYHAQIDFQHKKVVRDRNEVMKELEKYQKHQAGLDSDLLAIDHTMKTANENIYEARYFISKLQKQSQDLLQQIEETQNKIDGFNHAVEVSGPSIEKIEHDRREMKQRLKFLENKHSILEKEYNELKSETIQHRDQQKQLTEENQALELEHHRVHMMQQDLLSLNKEICHELDSFILNDERILMKLEERKLNQK